MRAETVCNAMQSATWTGVVSMALQLLLCAMFFLGMRKRWVTWFHTAFLSLQTAWLSRLLLYPAVSSLALGIFVGAVWVNMSSFVRITDGTCLKT